MKEPLTLNNKHLHYALLGIILALALYLRVDNLGAVQNFRGDQSRDYYVLMRWIHDGIFPCHGPYRSVGGDLTIGPGWYYLELPVFWLSNFHPSAGALIIVFFSMLTLWLSWLWVWRSSGSAPAALATAAVFAVSTSWIATSRTLWQPHIIPFGAICFATIMERVERRPVACLFGFLMLNAIMPHWHSTGILVMIAAFPPTLLAFRRARGRFREASRREWLAWGAAFAVLALALYLPPVIHELKYHTGNLPNYLGKTFIPSPPRATPLAQRLADGTDRLIALVARQSFFFFPRPWQLLPSRIAAVAVAVLFILIYGRMLWRDRSRASLSPGFWALLIGGYWLILVLKGQSTVDYFLHPVLAPPLLLGGWVTGRLLRSDAAAPWLRRLARAGGWTLLGLGMWLAVAQLPTSGAFRTGKYSKGITLKGSREIAQAIARDAAGKKFGILYTDSAKNAKTYIPVLTRMAGARAENSDLDFGLPAPRQMLGERLYIVVRGPMDEYPVFNGPALDLGQPVLVDNARIYRVPMAKVPPEVDSIFLDNRGKQWIFDVHATPAPAPPATPATPRPPRLKPHANGRKANEPLRARAAYAFFFRPFFFFPLASARAVRASRRARRREIAASCRVSAAG